MADNQNGATTSQTKPASSATDAAAKAPKGNPVFRMMGLPNFRLRLPSRNWMIFLTVVGSWTTAVVYDRRQKKKVQQKWCTLVSHMAKEPLPVSSMPRKISIYLSAPPADGLMSARDHFHEYVKPVLVASGLDWDVVEGRREGDVRAGLAERIRKLRKMQGEQTSEPLEEGDVETVVNALRERVGIRTFDGVAGDLVIGRNTWKEYIRGLHEGWLGPLDAPKPPPEASLDSALTDTVSDAATPSSNPLNSPTDDASPTADSTTATPEPSSPEEKAPETPSEEPAKPAKRKQPPPFIYPSSYPTAALAQACPPEFPPSNAIPFPHILGFFNFPIRMYRFLNRRHTADEIGRQTAAVALAAYRPYHRLSHSSENLSTHAFESDEGPRPGSAAVGDEWEQQMLLRQEEAEWHKSVRKRAEGEEKKESVWLDGVVLDPRLAERMRRFELTAEEEGRSTRIAEGKERELGRVLENEQGEELR